MNQKILVFGSVQANFVFQSDFNLKSVINNQLTIDDYQFEIIGDGYKIATALADKATVSLSTQLGRDFLADQIIDRLNYYDIGLEYLEQTAAKTNCSFELINRTSNQKSSLEVVDTKLTIEPTKISSFDYFVLTDVLSLEQLDQLLHRARNNQIKVAYYLTRPIAINKLIHLLDDVDLLIIDQTNLFTISRQKSLEMATNWLTQQVDNFIIQSTDQYLIHLDKVSYQISNIKPNFDCLTTILAESLISKDLSFSLKQALPESVIINERSLK